MYKNLLIKISFSIVLVISASALLFVLINNNYFSSKNESEETKISDSKTNKKIPIYPALAGVVDADPKIQSIYTYFLNEASFGKQQQEQLFRLDTRTRPGWYALPLPTFSNASMEIPASTVGVGFQDYDESHNFTSGNLVEGVMITIKVQKSINNISDKQTFISNLEQEAISNSKTFSEKNGGMSAPGLINTKSGVSRNGIPYLITATNFDIGIRKVDMSMAVLYTKNTILNISITGSNNDIEFLESMIDSVTEHK